MDHTHKINPSRKRHSRLVAIYKFLNEIIDLIINKSVEILFLGSLCTSHCFNHSFRKRGNKLFENSPLSGTADRDFSLTNKYRELLIIG